MCKIGSMVLCEVWDLQTFDLQALAVLDGQDVLTCARGTNRPSALADLPFGVWCYVGGLFVSLHTRSTLCL